MSEFQRIAFRAIDAPVSEKNLEYMGEQSSRADIPPWTFDNEYQYGDFRGDAFEMLRRGYDLHFHYADFGIRKLLVRLPHGLPDPKAAKPYLGEDSFQFVPDKKGSGGVLSIQLFHEPGDMEDLWEFDSLVERLLPLRAEILNGDLRPLYLAHLAIACDGEHDPEETKDAPVPAGLAKLSPAQRALAELYDLSDALIAAAAVGAPPLTPQDDPENQHLTWLADQPPALKDRWLADWMNDAHSSVRSEMLTEFRKSRPVPAWPTLRRDRTIAELMTAAEDIQRHADQKAQDKAARQRVKHLADMAADQEPTLRKTEKLAAHRSVASYEEIATLLADLREALKDTKQSGLPEEQARKLKKENPTLARLVSALRQEGFLGK